MYTPTGSKGTAAGAACPSGTARHGIRKEVGEVRAVNQLYEMPYHNTGE